MNKVGIISVIAFYAAFNTSGAYGSDQVWNSSSKNDEFTKETTYSAYGVAGTDHEYNYGKNKTFISRTGYSFGVRCDVSKHGDKDFMLTFSVDNALATPNSDAYIYLKVDKHPPIELVGKLFSNSYKSGFVRMSAANKKEIEKWIAESTSGQNMIVRVHDERKSNIEDYSVLLRGFTSHTSEALKACGISSNEPSISKADRERLQEIDRQIKALEKEKSKIIMRN